MITFDNLTFRYSSKSIVPAVSHVTGTVPEGITLLLGENGAGKTTLLRLMSGRLVPDEGCVDIDGGSPDGRMPSVLSNLYYVADNEALPRRDIMTFARDFGRCYPHFSAELFAENLSDFGLTGTERYDALSLGNRHKSILAFALSLGVDLLLLDEPANGLDITSKGVLRHMMARCIQPGQTVVISTHTVGDLHELYDGVLVMSKGRLILDSPTWKIAERLSFGATDIPPHDALYFEQRAGRFLSIRPLAEGMAPTEVDFSLLYTALLSARGAEIINLLNDEN